jgi:hypothetical protein
VGRSRSEAHLGNAFETLCRNTTKVKRAGRVTQVIKRLPSKCEALSPNPRTAEKIYTEVKLKFKKLPWVTCSPWLEFHVWMSKAFCLAQAAGIAPSDPSL